MLMFRADGNSRIGAGHIMRCLSVADAGKKYFDQDSVFVLASGDLEETITNRGVRCVLLGTDYRCMGSETEKMEELIGLWGPSAVFVDSYYVNPHYLGALQGAAAREGGRLAYIDDVMAFAYPCDVLINYNIYGPDNREEYERLYRTAGVSLPKLLLGTSYVPLRAAFQDLGERRAKKEAKHILISTGGADPDHVSLRLAEYLESCMEGGKGAVGDWGLSRGGIQFHFVIGAMNGDCQKIKEIAEGCECISIHYNVREMEQLMGRCDAALSAAGSTLYELCAAQTPAVTYILADNQAPGAEGFERHHILRCAGDIRNMTEKEVPEKLLGEVLRLAMDYEERKKISAGQRRLVDGTGARRIVEAVGL